MDCNVTVSELTLNIKDVIACTQVDQFHFMHYLKQGRIASHRVTKQQSDDINAIVIQSKKYLVFINNNSGSGKAGIYFNQVQWLFNAVKAQLTVVQTQRRYHCQQYMAQLKTRYDGYYIFSGDGLVHQFVNGIQKNPYKQEIRAPLCAMPCGSGNALAATIQDLMQVKTNQAILAKSLKGMSTKMNLMQIQFKESRIMSFLSVQFGMIAHIDKHSQVIRFMGALRFTLYAVYEIIKARTFRTKIKTAQQQLQGNIKSILMTIIPYIKMEGQVSPLVKVDKRINIQILQDCKFWDTVKFMLNFQNGDVYDRQKGVPREQFKFKHIMCEQALVEIEDGFIMIDGQFYEGNKIKTKLLKNAFQVFS